MVVVVIFALIVAYGVGLMKGYILRGWCDNIRKEVLK